MRIATVGGGPAGLYFALLMKLRHPDYDVRLYERNARGASDGYGLVFWDDLLEQLHDNDPVSASAIASASYYWVNQVIDLDGERLLDEESSGYGLHRKDLVDILARRAEELGVHVQYSTEVGSRAELGAADLVVAGDGVNSRLRSERRDRFGSRVENGANKYLWLATDRVFNTFEFGFVKTEPGWIWSAAYGIDTVTSTFVVECPALTWSGLGLDGMPAEASLSVLDGVFKRQLDGGRLSGQLYGRDTLMWLNFKTLTNERWHDGDVVLLGDAAHTTHFSIGSGTRLAFEDAISLANQLDQHQDRESAFSAYESERKAQLRRPQLEARLSARWHEQVDRYACLAAEEFTALWLLRRSPVLSRMNPHLYYRLHEATSKLPPLRRARDFLGLRARGRPGPRPELTPPPMVPAANAAQ